MSSPGIGTLINWIPVSYVPLNYVADSAKMTLPELVSASQTADRWLGYTTLVPKWRSVDIITIEDNEIVNFGLPIKRIDAPTVGISLVGESSLKFDKAGEYTVQGIFGFGTLDHTRGASNTISASATTLGFNGTPGELYLVNNELISFVNTTTVLRGVLGTTAAEIANDTPFYKVGLEGSIAVGIARIAGRLRINKGLSGSVAVEGDPTLIDKITEDLLGSYKNVYVSSL